MKTLVTLYVCLFMGASSFACLNAYHTLKIGLPVFDKDVKGDPDQIWTAVLDTHQLQEYADRFLTSYQRSDSIEYYSDYAATLIYLGHYEQAKEIYLEIETLAPNLYSTASNLGTAYELLSINDSAHYWIKKGMELNPDSHGGSEWIHLKILEYKLSGATTVDHSILDLDFGQDTLPENIHKYDLDSLSRDIWYQLSERTIFVKPEDPIVGSIFNDYANIISIRFRKRNMFRRIINFYEAAETYGFSTPLLVKRKTYLEKLNHIYVHGKPKKDSGINGIYILISLVALLLVVFLILKKRKLTQ